VQLHIIVQCFALPRNDDLLARPPSLLKRLRWFSDSNVKQPRLVPPLVIASGCEAIQWRSAKIQNCFRLRARALRWTATLRSSRSERRGVEAHAPLRKRVAFVAGNDVDTHDHAFPRRKRAQVLPHHSAQRGRGECRAPIVPAASRGKNKNHTSIVTAGTRRNHPAFPHANGFNGFLRALLGEPGFLATIARRSSSTGLISASGYQDHTTSPSA
jgi:hypothetical protein